MAFAHPSQFLLADLQLAYRPQREWVQGRGIFLILAHFLSGAGAGAWLFSGVTGDMLGYSVGWVLVAVGGFVHLLFLGRWTRFWRIISHPESSWISRGLLSMTGFLIAGAIYLLLALGGAGSSAFGSVVWWIAIVGAAAVITYKGFVWASSKGIPLWNTPLLPPLYITYGLRGGLAILLLVSLGQPGVGRAVGGSSIETLKLWFSLSAGLLVLFYLAVVRGTGRTAAQSVQSLLTGSAASVFYAGVVVLGLLVPLGIGGYALLTPAWAALLAIVGVSSLIGDLALLYAVARAGLYRPLPG